MQQIPDINNIFSLNKKTTYGGYGNQITNITNAGYIMYVTLIS